MVLARIGFWLGVAVCGFLPWLITPASVADRATTGLADRLTTRRQIVQAQRQQRAPSVAVVAIDGRSQAKNPIDSRVLAQALDELNRDQVGAVGVAIRYANWPPTDADREAVLSASLIRTSHLVLRDDLLPTTRESPGALPRALKSRAVTARGQTQVNTDRRGVARSVTLSPDCFCLELLQAFQPGTTYSSSSQSLFIQARLGQPVRIPLLAGAALAVDYAAAPAIPVYSLADLLAGTVDRKLLQGKLVLLGTTAAVDGRWIQCPGEKSTSELEFEAGVVQQLLEGRTIEYMPGMVPLLAHALAMVIVCWLTERTNLLVGLASAILLIVVQVGASGAMYAHFGWMPVFLQSGIGLLLLPLLVAGARLRWRVEEIHRRITAEIPALTVEQIREAGVAAFDKGDFAGALRLFQQLVHSPPPVQNEAIHHVLLCQLQLRSFDRFEQTFERLNLAEVNLVDAYSLGERLMEEGYHDEAQSVFTTIHERDVTFRDISNLMARAKQAQASNRGVMERLVLKELRQDYQNLEMFGRGGMALLYRGYSTELDRPVAIKILYPHLNSDEGLVRRFFLEAETLLGFDMPNIVKVFRIKKDGTLRHYVMEEVHPAISLHERIQREGKLSIERSIKILKQMCLALDYAHTRNIIHRDVKPHNVLVTDTDVVKLIDFGIARFEELNTQTGTGVVMGTLRYMSPEQLKGARVDERTDIFACGVTMFEMLTGITGTDNPVLEKIKGRTTIYQLILRQQLPSSLVRVVLKCLEEDRTKRYTNVRELIDDLEVFESSPPGELDL